MTDMLINGIGSIGSAAAAGKVGKTNGAGGFDDLLKDALGKISQVQQDTETAVKELTSGRRRDQRHHRDGEGGHDVPDDGRGAEPPDRRLPGSHEDVHLTFSS